MASVQEPEVQLAQRLASNEKPVRTKAMKKLRKYINVRSHNAAGGFTGDELLKLWKGLFYCLWMQDKPLLQEELSNQICTLIHSFHDIDGQFLYLENFLQTFKREWAGIDRLRMDKFLQLVRFMFRQTFEILKKKDWDSSLVGRFLELLTVQLLQSSSEAPSGLQFHILDLYMTELAAVGSAELTADQNLIFIEPFCKTAAKTKDRSLFGAICNSILSTIIDQAPFAIEDLMKEVKASEDSDSGQASEEDDKEDQPKESKSKAGGKKWRQINGNKSSEEEGQDDDDDDDDDDDNDDDDEEEEEEEEEELLHLEDSDTEMSRDDDIGPVLQFDYAALADKLFELASRSSTPSHNRQRLYKIVKLLRDLNEGVFPQDEYPEEVSTDEDDDMFGSRKRMKRGGGHMEEEDDEGAPAAKKTKRKKKKASTLNKQSNDSGVHEEQATLPANNEKKKKRRKRKKKKNAGQDEDAGGEGHIERCEEELTVAQSQTAETEGSLECSQTEDLKQEVQPQSSSVRVTEAATPEGQSQTLLLSEGKKQPTVTVTEETSQSSPCTSDDRDQSEMFSKKTERETSEVKAEVTEAAEGQQSVATVPGKKKKKKKCLKAEEVQDKAQLNGVNTEADFPLAPCEDSKGGGPTSGLEKQTDSETLSSKKRKKKNLKADEAAEVEAEHTNAEIPSVNQEASQDAAAVAPKKKTKKKGKQEDAAGEAVPAAEETTVTPQRKKGKKNQKEPKTTVEEEGKAAETSESADADKLLFEITMTTSAKKKKKKKKLAADKELQKDQTQPQLAGSVNEEGSSSGKPAKKKKRKIPVEFEYEVDELRAAAQQDEATTSITAEQPAAKKSKAGSNVGEPSTSLNIKMSQKKAKTSSELASKFITFQSKAPVPAPLFCKTKGSPKNQKAETPRAESKKVTFGLKNNKTAEFRKTDRSLLVSPDGSSRVPFDPKQRPKCGVLKSPPTPLSIKKTPKKVNKKSSSMTPKSALKRRL